MDNTDNKETKVSKLQTLKWLLLMFFLFLIIAQIQVFLENTYWETNNLLFCWLSTWFNDSLFLAFFWFGLALFIGIGIKKDLPRFSLCKFMGIIGMIAVIIVAVSSLFPVSERYYGVEIAGEMPSKWSYKNAIFCDLVEKDTVSVAIASTELKTSGHRYGYKARSSASGHYACYIDYVGADGKEYGSYESEWITNYVGLIKEQAESINIEYYLHSGVIKSIDGIEKNNTESLLEHLEFLKAERQRNQELAEEAERQHKLLVAQGYSIVQNSVGTDFADVLKGFEELGLPFTYQIHYISSQMYEINTVAFRDNENVYVVKDNEKEDMVRTPAVAHGMTRETVIHLLTECGLSYDVWDIDCDLHTSGTLHGFQFPAGTWVPRGYEVGFTVDT